MNPNPTIDLVSYGFEEDVEFEVVVTDAGLKHYSIFIRNPHLQARYFLTTEQLLDLSSQLSLVVQSLHPPTPGA